MCMLREMSRIVSLLWDYLPPETKDRLYRLADTIANSPLSLPSVDEVYSLVEQDDPAYMRLLEEGTHAAMEGRSVPLAESYLKKFLG